MKVDGRSKKGSKAEQRRRWNKWARMYKGGLNATDVARRCGYTVSAVIRALRKLGIREVNPPIPEGARRKRDRRIASQFKAGMSVRQIALKTGWSKKVVKNAILRNGKGHLLQTRRQQVRESPAATHCRHKQWATAYLAGKSMVELEIETGYSRSTIAWALRKLGVSARGRIRYGNDQQRRRLARLQNRKRQHRRWSRDPHYILGNRLRSALRSRLKNRLRGRRVSAVRNLGCSVDELIEKFNAMFRDGMTWENHGTHWHIDHIKPFSAFDLTDPDQLLQAVHYTNLQPLLAHENLSKGGVRRPRARKESA